jgi:hypothetical protein
VTGTSLIQFVKSLLLYHQIPCKCRVSCWTCQEPIKVSHSERPLVSCCSWRSWVVGMIVSLGLLLGWRSSKFERALAFESMRIRGRTGFPPDEIHSRIVDRKYDHFDVFYLCSKLHYYIPRHLHYVAACLHFRKECNPWRLLGIAAQKAPHVERQNQH